MNDKILSSAKSAERMAFEIYLRTGQNAQTIEVKFNPWHDPDDGRFTFAGHGRHSSSEGGLKRPDTRKPRGNGGSFGGGGASGSWKPTPKPPIPHSPKPISQSAGKAVSKRPVPAPEQVRPTITPATEKREPVEGPTQRPPEPPYASVSRNGYDFDVDTANRTRRARGNIHFAKPEPRSRRMQADAGKPDRRGTDDGGHYIAARFGGPREAFNHFAQDSNVNRGRYRAIEESWAKNVREGHRVFVDIVPHYHGASRRPYSLDVTWYVDSERYYQEIPNEKRGQ